MLNRPFEKVKREARMNRLKLPQGRKIPMSFRSLDKISATPVRGNGKNLLKKTQAVKPIFDPVLWHNGLGRDWQLRHRAV